ncbi:MAG: hypothetical protein V1648_02320 [Candidatus Aenigmatarchaeota archaeon]
MSGNNAQDYFKKLGVSILKMEKNYAELGKNFIQTDEAALKCMIELSKELTGPYGSIGCVLYIQNRAMKALMQKTRKEGSPPPYIITEDLVRSLGITREDFAQASEGLETFKMPDPKPLE